MGAVVCEAQRAEQPRNVRSSEALSVAAPLRSAGHGTPNIKTDATPGERLSYAGASGTPPWSAERSAVQRILIFLAALSVFFFGLWYMQVKRGGKKEE